MSRKGKCDTISAVQIKVLTTSAVDYDFRASSSPGNKRGRQADDFSLELALSFGLKHASSGVFSRRKVWVTCERPNFGIRKGGRIAMAARILPICADGCFLTHCPGAGGFAPLLRHFAARYSYMLPVFKAAGS
jgi:hypothetical protein